MTGNPTTVPVRTRARASAARTRLVVAALVGALAVTGLAQAAATVVPDDGYASPTRIQSGYGPAGPVTTTKAATGTSSMGYGSAALIQLGHGPGGPTASS